MSWLGHSRPGRASSKSGHVRNTSKAEVISEHWHSANGPLRVDAAAADMIQARHHRLLRPEHVQLSDAGRSLRDRRAGPVKPDVAVIARHSGMVEGPDLRV